MASNIEVKLKQDTKNNKYYKLYLKNVPVAFASVLKPRFKYQSKVEKEYSANVFVDEAAKDKLEDEVKLNKTLIEVFKGKNSKKKVAYPKETYGEVENIEAGMYGFKLTQNAKSKAGKPMSVTVIDKEGGKFDQLIGNGSICNIVCAAWYNDDDLLTARLNTVQVLDHIPYEGNGGVVEDSELGVSYEIQYADDSDDDTESTEVSEDSDLPFDDSDDEDYE